MEVDKILRTSANLICADQGNSFVQGGITEEQMLKFMGADTNLSPLQAKRLLEVILFPMSSWCVIFCLLGPFSSILHLYRIRVSVLLM